MIRLRDLITETARTAHCYIYIKPLVKHKQYDTIKKLINRIDYA
jgi:hypothetical protein